MVVKDVLHPLLGADVGIDFGGEDAFVAQHLLHCAKVGAVLHQMGGKGVAEGVWRDVFGDTGSFGRLLYNCKNHHSGKASSAAVEEKGVI